MRRVGRPIAFVLAAGLLTGLLVGTPAGCGGEPAAPASGVETVASGAAAELRLRLDREEMRTVDRLRVEALAAADPGVETQLRAPDFEAAGWTIVSGPEASAPRLEDGRVVQRTAWTLEPFLDGDYVVPPAELEWRPADASAAAQRLVTEPLEVRVVSVLPAEGEAELAAKRGPIDPPGRGEGPRGSRRLGQAIAAVAIVAAGGLIAWRLRRGRTPEADPLDQALRAAGRSSTPPERLALAALIVSLMPSGRLDASGARRLEELRRELERLRYDPTARPDAETTAAVLREAAALAERARDATPEGVPA